MDSICEIDKAGRIVVPKKFRDALHLVPGTRLILHREGDRMVIQPETPPRGLYMKKGIMVYDPGPVPPSNVADWVDEDRKARMNAVLRELNHQ